MSAFYRPETLDAALDVLADGPVTVAAGCTDLFPATDARALRGPVLDITGIPSLRGIKRTAEGLRIGATTTWTEIQRADLPPAFDMLKDAAREVGSVQIQNAGTIAGNICNASPAADGVPCLMALDTTVELSHPAGHRHLPLASFLTGPRQTSLQAGEMVVALHIPAAAMEGRSRFLKLGARRYLVISIAMVAVRVAEQNGVVRDAAISVGACSAVAARLTSLEAALRGTPLSDLTKNLTDKHVTEALSPIDDIRADSAYRGKAAVELVRRALDDLSLDTQVAA